VSENELSAKDESAHWRVRVPAQSLLQTALWLSQGAVGWLSFGAVGMEKSDDGVWVFLDKTHVAICQNTRRPVVFTRFNR